MTDEEWEQELTRVVDDLRLVLASFPLNWRKDNTENVKRILRRLKMEIEMATSSLIGRDLSMSRSPSRRTGLFFSKGGAESLRKTT